MLKITNPLKTISYVLYRGAEYYIFFSFTTDVIYVNMSSKFSVILTRERANSRPLNLFTPLHYLTLPVIEVCFRQLYFLLMGDE